MAVPYVVRKKADLTSGERKELWYAVPKTIQKRGGIKNKELAVRMQKDTGFHRGQIEGILSELADCIQDLLSEGHSVTIDGLGTFQAALTSPGFEHPEQVTPGKVSVSRIYFVAGPQLNRAVKKMKCWRVPFKYYMPESLLTQEMKKADHIQEKEETGWEAQSEEDDKKE